MTTWYRGRQLVTAERFEVEGPLQDFVKELRAHDPPVSAGARHRRLHEPRQGDGAALDASLRRPPALAARERGHPLAGDDAGPADQAQGTASRSTTLGYRGRPHHLRPGQARLRRGVRRARSWSGRSRRPASSARSTPRDASFYLSRVELIAERPARDEPLAQAALPGHGADRARSRPTTSSCRASGRSRSAPRSSSECGASAARARRRARPRR